METSNRHGGTYRQGSRQEKETGACMHVSRSLDWAGYLMEMFVKGKYLRKILVASEGGTAVHGSWSPLVMVVGWAAYRGCGPYDVFWSPMMGRQSMILDDLGCSRAHLEQQARRWW